MVKDGKLDEFELKIASALVCEPSSRVDAAIHAAAVRQAWKNRMLKVFSPRRIAAAAAALIVAGGIAFSTFDVGFSAGDADFAQSLLDQQGLAEDDFLAACYCVL